MKINRRILAALAAALLCSCASGGDSHRPAPGVSVDAKFFKTNLDKYKNIALLDFSEGPAKGPGQDICSLAGLALNQGAVESGAGAIVADQFHIQMSRSGFAMIGRQKAREATAGLSSEAVQENGARLAQLAASALGADAVMMGCVARYDDLVGSWLMADKTAHVAFAAVIYDPKAGAVVWAGKFDKKQRSLFADLTQWRIFFRGGMVWQRAETLSAVGAGFLVESASNPAPVE